MCSKLDTYTPCTKLNWYTGMDNITIQGSSQDVMEGPFGLASSRCLPRWPWSVVDICYMSGASHSGGRGYRPQSVRAMATSGLSSTDPPGACSRLEKHYSAGAQQHGNSHRDEIVKVEDQRTFCWEGGVDQSVGHSKTKHHDNVLRGPLPQNWKCEGFPKTHRHVENAVDKAQGGENGFGVNLVDPRRSVKKRPEDRAWRCFPTLRQFRETLVGSKDNRQPTHLMAFQERLKCREKWPGGYRSFKIFLLEAPDCPDDVKVQLTEDANQGVHQAQDLNPDESQSTLLMVGRPQDENLAPPLAEQQQQREESSGNPSPASPQSKGKSRSPPGTAALRSLTPEGPRSKSQSPVRGGGRPWAEETSFTRNWAPRNSSSPALSTGPRGCVLLRSRPESPSRQRILRPRSCPKLLKGVDPWGSRDQQCSSRVHSRHRSPNRCSKITKNPSSSPNLPSYPPGDESEHERSRTSGPCSVRINSKMGIRPRTPNYRACLRPVNQSRLRMRRSSGPLGDYDRPGSPSLRSRNDRPAAKQMTNSPACSLALQLATNSSGTSAISSPSKTGSAHLRLVDAVPQGSFDDAHRPGDGGVVEAVSGQSPLVANMSTAWPRILPARSHIRLVDSLYSVSSGVKSFPIQDNYTVAPEHRPIGTR